MKVLDGSVWTMCIIALGTLTTAQAAVAQEFQFVEVGAARGLQPYVSLDGTGGGLAVSDYDDDGDLDIFACNELGAPDQLYRNFGNGTFEEVAAAVGLAATTRSRVALWLDYDADQDLDLLVALDCHAITCVPGESLLRLYRQNDTGTFTEVTAAAGLFDDTVVHDDTESRGGLSAGDINNDGFIDFFASMWHGLAFLYLNQGDGTFADISVASGISGPRAGNFQPIMHDFNGDGLTDISVTVDALDFPVPSRLWINQGDNTFIDIAAQAGADRFTNEMGTAISDYDNDGDLDLYMTNIHVDMPDLMQGNSLLRNDTAAGVVQFAEVAEQTGVYNTGFGWGTTFFDADNDGWVDLAATNGHFVPPYDTDPSKFFLNNGDAPVSFSDLSTTVGFDDILWGVSLIAFDSDRDGDLDLIQSTRANVLRLLENEPGKTELANHYLVIKPRMEGPNYRAIGAVVTARVSASTQTRLITAGTSFLGQEPAEAFFGLGEATSVDRVTVEWPDGKQSQVTNVAADQVLIVSSSFVFADGFESGDLSAWSSSTGT